MYGLLYVRFALRPKFRGIHLAPVIIPVLLRKTSSISWRGVAFPRRRGTIPI